MREDKYICFTLKLFFHTYSSATLYRKITHIWMISSILLGRKLTAVSGERGSSPVPHSITTLEVICRNRNISPSFEAKKKMWHLLSCDTFSAHLCICLKITELYFFRLVDLPLPLETIESIALSHTSHLFILVSIDNQGPVFKGKINFLTTKVTFIPNNVWILVLMNDTDGSLIQIFSFLVEKGICKVGM